MHFSLGILLLCPLAGLEVDELPARLMVEIERPDQPFYFGEPMTLCVDFTNDTPGPLEIGPFAIESGHVLRGVFVCAASADGGGENGSYTINNVVKAVIVRTADKKHGLNGEQIIVLEEIELVDELPRIHQFTLAPRSSHRVEFELANTHGAWSIDGPGEFKVELQLNFVTNYSQGFPVALKSITAWQGAVSSKSISLRVLPKR